MGTAFDGLGGTDSFDGIESVRGSDGSDTITGGIGDQTLEGMASADFLDGGTGGQTAGDTVSYNSSLSGVMVNLANHNALDSWGYTDAINNIENIRGSHFADNLIGDANNNAIWAQGGNDTIDGGAGMDTAQYSGLKSEYTVFKGVGYYTVTDTNAVNGDDGIDTLYGIEKLQFSDGFATLGGKLGEDFNGDGKSDTLLSNAGGSTAIWTMDGIKISASQVVGPYAGWTAVDGTRDFNGDGKSDVLLTNTSGAIAMWTMDGTNITASQVHGPYAGWNVVSGNSDFNGDGKSDLLLSNGSGSTAIWTMDGTNITASQVVGPYAGWTAVDGTRDFNGDGKSDVLLTNTSESSAVWTMDGTNITASEIHGPYAGWAIV